MVRVRFEGVSRHYPGAARPAVAQVDLTVADGETVALVGPAGAGKTTLLRLACGLEVPDRGRVVLGEGNAEHLEVVLLFQNYPVHPHRSVREYVTGDRRRGLRGRRFHDPVVDSVLEVLGLDDLRRRAVYSLSSSERMRMVLARSLVQQPDLLLLDEPFANLAPRVRADLLDRLTAAQELRRVTTLYVTEHLDEAERMATRVLWVADGQVQEMARTTHP